MFICKHKGERKLLLITGQTTIDVAYGGFTVVTTGKETASDVFSNIS